MNPPYGASHGNNNIHPAACRSARAVLETPPECLYRYPPSVRSARTSPGWNSKHFRNNPNYHSPRQGGESVTSSGASPRCFVESDGDDQSTATPEGRNMISEEELSEEILSQIPTDAYGRKLSAGSMRHATGECKPCVFYNNEKKGDCQNGVRCLFCHFDHPKRKKQPRPSKRQRVLQREKKVHNRFTEGYSARWSM